MNKPAPFIKQLSTFVKSGLLTFWRSALPDDHKIIPLLIMDLQDKQEAWSEQKAKMEKRLAKKKGKTGLENLVAEYKLSLADIFLLALLGEIETSHLVNMVIAELQLPDKSLRPSLHTLNAMAEALFDKQDGIYLHLSSHRLVKEGFILLEGEGPLPLQKARVLPSLWQGLVDNKTPWPGCQFIENKDKLTLGQKNAMEVQKMAALLQTGGGQAKSGSQALQAVLLRGTPNTGRGLFAESLATCLGLMPMEIPVETWQQYPVLSYLCRVNAWLPVLRPKLGPGEVFKLTALNQAVVIILGSEGSVDCDNLLEVNLSLSTQQERSKLWYSLLRNKALSENLGANALLSHPTIFALARQAKQLAKKENANLHLQHISDARRHHGAEKLRLLAEPIVRQVSADAMVLPPLVEEGLQHLIARARQRESLWQGLGETLKVTPNPGVRALFVGESGTGKTLAASYIASQLSAPLYRVDLSSVMNKYIGESEKNLAQLLDEAAANDVALLFDEADSLFGSRSDGKETGERFANMLTNFLLTRIENHPGVVILTTNSKERIDNAFNRRLDVIIDFPLPAFAERLALWHSHLGERGPSESVCHNLATYCDLAGGQVRNVVLAAAVYAEGQAITEKHLIQGLQAEYNKLGRPVPGKILRGL